MRKNGKIVNFLLKVKMLASYKIGQENLEYRKVAIYISILSKDARIEGTVYRG